MVRCPRCNSRRVEELHVVCHCQSCDVWFPRFTGFKGIVTPMTIPDLVPDMLFPEFIASFEFDGPKVNDFTAHIEEKLE
jgi:hypothetical protein